MIDSLLNRFHAGDRLALTRLVSLLARGQKTEQILSQLERSPKHTRVVALTGSGGVGKSTLAGKLIEHLRNQNQTVAVVACDPQSPVTGGALLGDRFRMPPRPQDDGVFIRSLAAPGGQGAVAQHLPALIRLLETFGFDVILIETVGAGQGDTRVHDLADVVVVLLQPETGDDLQWEKAGVLEIADVVVIHKADMPAAASVEAQVQSSLALPGAKPIPLIRVSSRTGEGIETLWQAVSELPLRRQTGTTADSELLRLAQEFLADRFANALSGHDPIVAALLENWRSGTILPTTAVQSLLERLVGKEPSP